MAASSRAVKRRLYLETKYVKFILNILEILLFSTQDEAFCDENPHF